MSIEGQGSLEQYGLKLVTPRGNPTFTEAVNPFDRPHASFVETTHLVQFSGVDDMQSSFERIISEDEKQARELSNFIFGSYLLRDKLEIDFQNLPYDNDKLRQWMVESAALNNAEFPAFLHHEGQVEVVANAIGRGISSQAQQEAQTYAITHDFGRRLTLGENHAIFSAALMKNLSMDKKYVEFGYVHHRGGLGTSDCPTVYINGDTPLELITETFKNLSNEERTKLVDEVLLNDTTDYYGSEILENIASEISNYVQKQFGPGGLAALVADMTKDYPLNEDGTVNHYPVIAEFNLELAHKLFERQVANYEATKHDVRRRGYERGSDQHFMDIAGALSIKKMVQKLESDYGVKYEKAVEEAQEEWPQNLTERMAVWNNAPDKGTLIPKKDEAQA